MYVEFNVIIKTILFFLHHKKLHYTQNWIIQK